MGSFRDLVTWQRAMDLVEHCYRISASFPPEERFGLTSQLRRAAVSIPSNVAEGHCRLTTKPYINHVGIALGSNGELHTCFEVARRLKYISQAEATNAIELTNSVGRLLYGLRASLERKAAEESS